jgi:inner membrane protein
MNGWWWLIAGLVLAGIELLVPGWAFMGLAASVGLMGVLMLTGLWTAGLPVTLVVTALLSAVAWMLFRRVWPTSQGSRRVWDRDINE